MQHATDTCLASSTDVLYLFAGADEVKYFADATQKTTIYDNDIPLLALCASHCRRFFFSDFSTEMLTCACSLPAVRPDPSLDSAAHFARAAQVVCAPASGAADATLFAPFTSAKLAALAKLFPREHKLVVKRTPFNNTIRRVFFLQGVFISLGSILVVVGSVLGYGGYTGVRWFRGV